MVWSDQPRIVIWLNGAHSIKLQNGPADGVLLIAHFELKDFDDDRNGSLSN